MNASRLLLATLAAAPLFALSAPARAASSYDGCTGFINALPAIIATQGVWCLKKDLATSIESGSAITINNSNVTIDCNGFKIGGLSAGPDTAATGISAIERSNITIRDCNIRGFSFGALLGGEFAGGHRVERNRFEFNTNVGVGTYGAGSIVRQNIVVGTGGSTGTPQLYTAAIVAAGRTDVVDNQVSGVDGTATTMGAAVGVLVAAPDGGAIVRNRIGDMIYTIGGAGYGIAILESGPVDVRHNTIAGGLPGASVVCASGDQFLYANALLMGSPLGSCADGGRNYGWDLGP